MQRKPLTLTVSLAAFALVALTGCSSGGDDAQETAAPATQAVTEQSPDAEAPDAGAPTLEGEGIVYGTESVTGVDFETTCVGSGEGVSVVAMATAEDGTQYTIAVSEGSFAFTGTQGDQSTALAAGTAAPGTDVSITENAGEYTATGTGTLVSPASPTPSDVSFTARVTCDSTM